MRLPLVLRLLVEVGRLVLGGALVCLPLVLRLLFEVGGAEALMVDALLDADDIDLGKRKRGSGGIPRFDDTLDELLSSF